MRKMLVGVVFLLMSSGGQAAFAGDACGPSSCAPKAKGASASSCTAAQGASACEAPNGKLTGNFDPAMSGVCKFACATKLKHDSKDVLAQPGAQLGKLTQCPVSGVVFVVDAHRPHVKVAGSEYVTCCEGCAKKLRQNPNRFLKA